MSVDILYKLGITGSTGKNASKAEWRRQVSINMADKHSWVNFLSPQLPCGAAESYIKYFLTSDQINEVDVLLNIHEITWETISCVKQLNTEAAENDNHQLKQARWRWTRQAVSHTGTKSSERKSRRAGSRFETVRGLIFGMDDQRMTSPPPGSPPSSLHYSPLLSEVNSWSSCETTSHTNTFIPSLTCGHTFLCSDVVFWAAHHLWEFTGSFSAPLYEVFRGCDG